MIRNPCVWIAPSTNADTLGGLIRQQAERRITYSDLLNTMYSGRSNIEQTFWKRTMFVLSFAHLQLEL